MPVPLENELTSDSDTYEDSFAYYVQKAREAAEYAGRKVSETIDLENQQFSAEVQVENTRQDALDRVEQICGEGITGCVVGKVPGTTKLKDLQILPPYTPRQTAWPPETCQKPDSLDLKLNPLLYIAMYGDYMNCCIDVFVEGVAMIELVDLSQQIYDAARNNSLDTLTFAEHGGEYKIALLELKNALVDIRSAAVAIRTSTATLGNSINANYLNFLSMQLDAAAQVFEGVASGLKSFGIGAVAGALKAASTIMKSFASQYDFLNKLISDLASVEQATLTIEKAATTLQENLERVRMLEREQQQSKDKAERQANAIVAQLAGSGSLKQYRYFSLMANVRARRAVRRAKKVAYIARKAVEFRMAVNLSQEREAGIAEDPPSKWADDLYTMMVAEPDPADPAASPRDTLSEYVQQLEDYVYYYPFQYPFADGSDTAVLSLRDDLSSLEETCQIATVNKNIVSQSEVLSTWTDSWAITYFENVEYGYGQTENKTADRARLGCFWGSCPSLGSEPSVWSGSPTVSDFTGSVYLKGIDPSEAVPVNLSIVAEYRLVSDPSQVSRVFSQTEFGAVNLSTNWVRHTATLAGLPAPITSPEVSAEYITVQIVLEPEAPAGYLNIDIWGAQIEPGILATSYEKTPYYELSQYCRTQSVVDPWTGDATEITYQLPSRRSDILRRSFRVKCVNDDFSSTDTTAQDCFEPDEYGHTRGGIEFLERDFSITLGGIEAGRILAQGEIGAGNYNYRIDSLALNLVGSNVKDCSLDPGAGTSCYTSQFIPYDLIQDGVVKIRNHSGVEMPFNLAIGRIHQGKALAAERLLTNPLSSTDSALMQQYQKREFRGRPIQGEYTLRIYATPSLRWTNVEDIQILLNYRYWSAFSDP